jgi:hypothetical protein
MIEGMKFQPCLPGFVDGRDAILVADQMLTGGQNQCLIWEAFANRGLGFSADQGASNSILDGTEAFDLPQFCEYLAVQPASHTICTGDTAEYEVTVGTAFVPDVTLLAAGHPAGTSATIIPNPVTTVPNTTTLTIGNTATSAPGSYSITLTATDSLTTSANYVVGLTVMESISGATSLTAPPDSAVDVPLQPTFVWTAVSATDYYLLEVDDVPDFASHVYSATVAGTSHIPAISLPHETTYYWRVTAASGCGFGPTSSIFSFTTTTDGFNIYLPAILKGLCLTCVSGTAT